MTVKKIWKCGDVEIVFRQVRRTLPRTKFPVLAEEEVAAGDKNADITGNIFPEGIQLGSTNAVWFFGMSVVGSVPLYWPRKSESLNLK